jgi:hypothetical protein
VQLFIFFTIKTFGSLANTLICTTRKFFNILISVVSQWSELGGYTIQRQAHPQCRWQCTQLTPC